MRKSSRFAAPRDVACAPARDRRLVRNLLLSMRCSLCERLAMTRLVYTLERKPATDSRIPARARSARTTSEDALIAMTMAALGLPLLRRHANGSGENATVSVTFPDDRVMAVFNLRVE